MIALSLALAQIPASFHNIQIATPSTGHQPCEPSIAISLADPKVIVAGVILDRAIYTADGGLTWKEVKLTSQYGVFGDPTLISDQSGGFYFFHLSSGKTAASWLDRIVCQKSTDGGKSWSDGAGIGFDIDTDQDKQWACVHPSKPYVYATWTRFDKYGQKDLSYQSNIMFSMSADAGETWTDAKKINEISGDCLDDDGTTEGAVPAVTKDGKVHVAWSNQNVIWYDRSADNGKTWLVHDVAVTRHYGGWNMDVGGVNRTNGMPVLMADNSSGANSGSLYIVWADQRAGVNDTDVFICASRDGGNTWGSPLRVNKDAPGKQNFLPWLAVDQATGYLYVVYYDRRAYADDQTDVYLAYSTDGGKSFTERKISESPFTPQANKFLGDYNNIAAHKGVIAPVWTRMENGNTSVWTAVIKHVDLIK